MEECEKIIYLGLEIESVEHMPVADSIDSFTQPNTISKALPARVVVELFECDNYR
jgi:hypothetical protein